MLILLEGVDGAGKTTFAEQLREKCDMPSRVIHRGSYDRNSYDEYENDLLDYSPSNNELVILDRWHISENIYGSVLRGQSKLSLYDTAHIDRFLLSRGALPIVLTASDTVLRERLIRRGETFVPLDKIALINAHYTQLAQQAGLTLLDTSQHDDAASLCLEVAHARAIVATVLDLPESYIGPNNPTAVVVCPAAGRIPLQTAPELATSNTDIGLINYDDLTDVVYLCLGSPLLFGLTDAISAELNEREYRVVFEG